MPILERRQGEERHRDQARQGRGLLGHRERAVLPRQHAHAVRRRRGDGGARWSANSRRSTAGTDVAPRRCTAALSARRGRPAPARERSQQQVDWRIGEVRPASRRRTGRACRSIPTAAGPSTRPICAAAMPQLASTMVGRGRRRQRAARARRQPARCARRSSTAASSARQQGHPAALPVAREGDSSTHAAGEAEAADEQQDGSQQRVGGATACRMAQRLSRQPRQHSGSQRGGLRK